MAENQRTRLTRQLLFHALVEMLGEMDMEKITVTELCRRAGINRTTFYKYYKIPHDVLDDLERSELEATSRTIYGEADKDYVNMVRAFSYMNQNSGVALALNEKSLKICMEGRFTSAEGDYLASLLSGGYPEGLAPYMRLIFLVAANHWLKDENRMSPEAFARFIWTLAGAARGLKGGAKH